MRSLSSRFDTVVTQELIIYLLRVYTRIRDSISTRGLFFSAFRKTRRGTLCRYIYIYPGAIRSGRARYPSIGVLVNQAPVRGSNTNRIEYRYLVSEFLKHLINLSIRGEIVLLDVSIQSILLSILLILHQQ